MGVRFGQIEVNERFREISMESSRKRRCRTRPLGAAQAFVDRRVTAFMTGSGASFLYEP